MRPGRGRSVQHWRERKKKCHMFVFGLTVLYVSARSSKLPVDERDDFHSSTGFFVEKFIFHLCYVWLITDCNLFLLVVTPLTNRYLPVHDLDLPVHQQAGYLFIDFGELTNRYLPVDEQVPAC